MLSKITRPNTVSCENTPLLNRYNARDNLKVLTKNLSLPKNMKTLLFAQHTHLGVMFATQSSLLLTLEYAVPVIFIPFDVQKLSPLENTEIDTPLIHHVHRTLSWSSHNLYVQKVSFTYSPIYFHPPPPTMIYIINKLLKYYSINYHFLNIT